MLFKNSMKSIIAICFVFFFVLGASACTNTNNNLNTNNKSKQSIATNHKTKKSTHKSVQNNKMSLKKQSNNKDDFNLKKKRIPEEKIKEIENQTKNIGNDYLSEKAQIDSFTSNFKNSIPNLEQSFSYYKKYFKDFKKKILAFCKPLNNGINRKNETSDGTPVA